MAVSTNNVSDLVKKSVGREATPYEIQQFSTAPIQTLANLPNYYSTLNKDASIVDYLKYVGQDPSMTNRKALGQQYGISNVGTAEGNVALLNALKAGAPAPTPVGGQITPSGASTAPSGTIPQTPEQLAEKKDLTGTVAGATQPVDTTPITGQPPEVSQETSNIKNQYTTVQQQVADIDNTVRQSEQNIKDEVARSGGIVDASQIKALVYERNKPLLDQRAQLVSQQGILGKQYISAIQADKQAVADYYKQQNLQLAQTKQEAQVSQFEQSLKQKGIKYLKYTDPDSGQTYYREASSGQIVTPSNISSVPSTTAPVDTTGYTLGVPTDTTNVWNVNDASRPDPLVANIPDPKTGRTPNDIWQSAITLALDKSATPQKFLGGLSGNSGPGKALKNAITNKSSALMAASGVLQPVLQQEFIANSKAINTQVGYLNSISRALNGAERGATLTQKLFSDKQINTDSSTWKNKTLNDLTKAFGDSGDIRAYQAAMVEIGNEYAQVFARGGMRSVQGNELAQEVINGNVKLADIQKTLDTLQQIGQTVVDTTIENVKSIAGGGGTESVASFLSYVYGGSSPKAPASSTTDIKSQITAKGYNYDDIKKQYPNATDEEILNSIP